MVRPGLRASLLMVLLGSGCCEPPAEPPSLCAPVRLVSIFDDVNVTFAGLRPAGTERPAVEPATLAGDRRPAIGVPGWSRWAIRVRPTGASRLRFATGVSRSAPDQVVCFTVSWIDYARRPLFHDCLGPGSPPGWFDALVDLRRFSGRLGILLFETHPGTPMPASGALVGLWGNPRLDEMPQTPPPSLAVSFGVAADVGGVARQLQEAGYETVGVIDDGEAVAGLDTEVSAVATALRWLTVRRALGVTTPYALLIRTGADHTALLAAHLADPRALVLAPERVAGLRAAPPTADDRVAAQLRTLGYL